MMKRNLQMEAAEALLDAGVSLPFIRIPFTGRPLRLTMRRPSLGSLIRIARLYLQLGVTCSQMEAFDKHEQLRFIAEHGRRVSLMIALTVCRGALSGALFARPLAWLIRWLVPHELLQAACRTFLSLLGTRPFMTIIASAERINPMTPRTSQDSRKGS